MRSHLTVRNPASSQPVQKGIQPLLLWFKRKVIYWKQFSMQVDAQDSYVCCSETQGTSVCTSPGCFLVLYFPPAFFSQVILPKFFPPEIGLFSFQLQWNRQGLCLNQVHPTVLAALPTTSLVPLIFQRCSAL